MEENLEEKLKEIRKILDDPFHTSNQKDKYLATLKKRLMNSPPSVETPRIVIFSKDILEEEKIEEDFIIKERDEDIVEGETLFTIEREEITGIPEFIEIKPEVPKVEDIDKKEKETEVKEEEIPEFIEVKPEESIKKSIEEKEKEIKESVEVKTEEKEEKLPEWKPVEKEVFEEKVEEKEKIKKPVEKKIKTREKKHRRRFQIWEPAEEKKVTKEKKKKTNKETKEFEPFFEEEFEEVEEKSKVEEKQRKEDVYKYRGYTLYRKEIILNDGSKRIIHFFSKEEPDEGEPSSLPEGYEIKMDKKTGIPFIRKKR